VRNFLPSIVALALLVVGCSAHRPHLPVPSSIGGQAAGGLRSGDLVVAVEKSKSRHVVLSVQRGLRPRPQIEPLFVTSHPVDELAVSASGRWLALGNQEGLDEGRVELWDLRPGPGELEPLNVWSSPAGCSGPDFEAGSRWMVVGCSRRGRQPASVLLLDLPSLEALQLVGEADRRAPIVGVEGDVYWSERRERHSVAVRRSSDGVPFVTHDLSEAISQMWPQLDGSLVVELDRRGSGRSFARLSTSGVARVEAPPAALAEGLVPSDVVYIGERGLWWVAGCERGTCSLRSAVEDELGSQIVLGGEPRAIAQVSWPRARSKHPEDLATAPASVLSSHPSTQVSVLGVSLGMTLEDTFSVLDRMGRHPYWIEGRSPRTRPRGVGVGWTAEGHCIEYMADERSSVTSIELQGCAASYVSPALRPLLDRSFVASAGAGLAREFFGEEVAVEVTGLDKKLPNSPVRRTDLRFNVPDRGYQFEARSEVLRSRSTRILGGWIRLRIELPGRRNASAAQRR